MNFITAFNSLKTEYEKKDKNSIEDRTYELLKRMIETYGYNSVCNEITLNKKKYKQKNTELSIFMNEVKKNIPLELLCSQLFYLDNSFQFLKNNKNENMNNENIINVNHAPTKFMVLDTLKNK